MTTKEQTEQAEENTITRGYVIGIDQNQHIAFNTIGENLTLSELAGLHKIAEFKIESAIQSSLSSGWPLVAMQVTKNNTDISQVLDIIANHLQQLSEKLEKLTEKSTENFLTTPIIPE